MSLLYDTAKDLQRVCRESGWKFCFIGGIAVQRWGEPRFTHDADLTVLTGFGSEASYIERLLGKYEPRTSDAAAFAVKSRVLLLKAPNGIPIDVSLGAIDFEARMIERASDWDAADGVVLTTAAPTTSSCSRPSRAAIRTGRTFGTSWPARPASSTRRSSSASSIRFWSSRRIRAPATG